MYTLIKIDEVNNLGAVRIRIRSLLSTIKKREGKKKSDDENGNYEINKIPFTKEMKESYTILNSLKWLQYTLNYLKQQ